MKCLRRQWEFPEGARQPTAKRQVALVLSILMGEVPVAEAAGRCRLRLAEVNEPRERKKAPFDLLRTRLRPWSAGKEPAESPRRSLYPV